MTDEEFNELIRAGLLRRAAGEAAALREQPVPAPDFSSAYRRWERRFLADPFAAARRAARPAWLRFVRAAAVIFLVLSLSFGALVAVSPSARAWVQRIVVQWFDEYASFGFVGDGDQTAGELGEWRPTWLPEGYELVDEFNPFGNSVDLEYQDEDGNAIYLGYMLADGNVIHIDDEHHVRTSVAVNGGDGYLLIATDRDSYNSLTWMDSTHDIGFYVVGKLTDIELIRIAESMSQK